MDNNLLSAKTGIEADTTAEPLAKVEKADVLWYVKMDHMTAVSETKNNTVEKLR